MRIALLVAGIGLFVADAIGGVMTVRPSPVRSLGAGGVAAARAMRVEPTLIDALDGLTEVLIDDFRLPDGEPVTLHLTPVIMDVGPTWIVDDSGVTAPRRLPPEPVKAWTGSVLGEPDSRVFLGFAGSTAHGWVETTRGLDMLVTDPSNTQISFYRVGQARGGVEVQPPGTALKDVSSSARNGSWSPPATEEALIRSELRRLLQDMDGDGPLSDRMDPETYLNLYRLLDADDDSVNIFASGGCCLAPGYCYTLTEALCAELCAGAPDDLGVRCDNLAIALDPSDPSSGTDYAPCWLGAGVPCNAQWVCFEAGTGEYDGAWVGACCYPDPVNPGVQVLGDLQACECAILGGRFLLPPKPCVSDGKPWEIPADRFMSAGALADVICVDNDGDPLPLDECQICYEPSGACCLDQGLFCQDVVDEGEFPNLSSVRCAQLPRSVCESDDENVLAVLNASVPGYFIQECMPCIDQTDLALYEDDDLPPPTIVIAGTPPVCSSVTPVVEYADPENPLSGSVVELLGPRSLICEGKGVLIDSDPFFVQLFGGDYVAASGYARILAASVFSTIERDAAVQFSIAGVVLHDWLVTDPDPAGIGDLPDIDGNQLSIGACCLSGAYCYENISAYQCAEYAGDWLGEGASCWTNECGDGVSSPNDILQHAPLDITQAIDRLQEAWTVDLDEWAGPNPDNNNEALAELFCTATAVVALGAAPYYVPSDSSEGPADGVYRQGVATSGVGVLCQREDAFALVPVRGGFAPPPSSHPPPAEEGMWDFVQFARAMGLLAGVNATSLYGYDSCITFPCDSMAALPDCTLRYEDPAASALGVMPSTIMSNCLTCDGGLANIQLRYRNEIAARIYSSVAALECGPEAAGAWPPICATNLGSGSDYVADQQYPIPISDVLIVPDLVSTTLDVLANDIPCNCNGTSDGDAIKIIQGSGSMIDCSSGSVLTTLGGAVCLTELPSGVEVVEYTPPVDWCGIDSFVYEVENCNASQPNPATTVYLVPDTGDLPLSPLAGSFSCVSISSIAESSFVPASILDAPPPITDCGSDPTVICYRANNVGASIKRIRWDNARLVVHAGHQSESILRFWFASVPGGAADVFFDVSPFAPADPSDPYPYCATATGTLSLPNIESVFVPVGGLITVQCYETFDDGALPDAEWKSFNIDIDLGSNSSVLGVCCVEGLCLDELTANECADFHWRWDEEAGVAGEWVEDLTVSGFFYGAGKTCDDLDWCTRRAPCCLGSVACVEVAPDVCTNDLDGTVLTLPDNVFNPDEPLWGYPCTFTVCDLDPTVDVIGGCCLNNNATGLAFCTDTTMDICDGLPALLPGAAWESTWQVRAKCTATACGTGNGPTGGVGACCFDDLNCCTDGLTAAVCAEAYGLFMGTGSTCADTCPTSNPVDGVCCFDSSSIGGWACIEGLPASQCTLIGGNHNTTLTSCSGLLPCDPGVPIINCCVDYQLLVVDSAQTCWEAGGLLAGVDGVDPDCDPLDGVIAVNGNTTSYTVWAPTFGGTPLGFFNAADFDRDGRVGVPDLLMLLDFWLGDGPNSPAGDLDGDGMTGVVDLLLLFENWG